MPCVNTAETVKVARSTDPKRRLSLCDSSGPSTEGNKPG